MFCRDSDGRSVALGLLGDWAVDGHRSPTGRLSEAAELFVVVASRQRSSSSSSALSRVLASHPCALHGNEIWIDGEAQDHLGAHNKHTGMSWKEIGAVLRLFLANARSKICAEAAADGTIPDTRGGQCVPSSSGCLIPTA